MGDVVQPIARPILDVIQTAIRPGIKMKPCGSAATERYSPAGFRERRGAWLQSNTTVATTCNVQAVGQTQNVGFWKDLSFNILKGNVRFVV